MPEQTENPSDPASGRAAGAALARVLARADGWRMQEYVCRSGPQDKPFEERREDVTIAAVVSGSFQYRSSGGSALFYPGSFLLQNPGTCFECGHDHGVGDHCISFQFEPSFFEEIAAGTAGTRRFRFPRVMLPAMHELAVPLVEVATATTGINQMYLDELAVRLAETVVTTLSGAGVTSTAAAARDQRRIGGVLRYIEEHAEQALDLATLAKLACMSKYHFLRSFRQVVGVTPYRFLLGMRLRRAAIGLRNSATPVAVIAYDNGFGDLSTFNAQFRQVFGRSPSVFRGDRKPKPGRALRSG